MAFGSLILLPGLGALDALDSTDARYLEIAREMYTSGEALMPTLAGVPHLHKPPLTYWAACVGYALFGVSPFAGRFVEQLVLLGTALLLLGHGRRWGGEEAGLVAPLVFLSSLLVFGVSRGLSTDLFQLLLLTGALLALLRGSLGDRPRRRALEALALLGISVLVKGPIALWIAALVWIAYRTLGGQRLSVSWRVWATGWTIFAAIAAPWYGWLVAQSPGLLGYLIGEQLWSRLRPGGLGHQHGWSYIVVSWLWGSLPWTPLLLLTLSRLHPWSRPRSRRDPVDLFLWVWTIVPVVLFSLPASKLPTYVLPSLPAGALLLARATARKQLQGATARRCTQLALGCSALLGMGVGALLLWPGSRALLAERLTLEAARAPLAAGLLLLGLGALAGWQALRTRASTLRTRALASWAAATALALCVASCAVSPTLPSYRPAAELAASVPGARLVFLRTFKSSVLFYFEDLDRVYVADVRALAERPLGSRPQVSLHRDAAIALMRESRPTFALTRRKEAQTLGERMRATTVWCGRKHCLLANPAARSALPAPSPTSGSPRVPRAVEPSRSTAG